MGIFKRTETNAEIGERIWGLTDKKDYGIFPPPMEAQVALNELCEFFLGEDWYSVNPICQEQINTEIVYKIECRYKKLNKKESVKRCLQKRKKTQKQNQMRQ